jgi:hypothetical protein
MCGFISPLPLRLHIDRTIVDKVKFYKVKESINEGKFLINEGVKCYSGTY